MSTTEIASDLVGVPELAARLGCDPSRVYRAVRRGDFPLKPVPLWSGAHMKFRRVDVDRHLKGKAS